MKIGILTYHRAKNYGAFLQAYGLCSRLNQEENIEAELIDFRMQCEIERYQLHLCKNFLKYIFYKNNHHCFEKSAEKYLKLSKKSCVSDSIDVFRDMVKDQYDVIIAGSDEIWKTDSFRGFPTPYWLPGDLGCRKFAYAISARSDFSKLSQENQQLLSSYVNDFGYIGARDGQTYVEVKKHERNQNNLEMVCDPVFLYDYTREISQSDIYQKKNKKPQVIIMMENQQLAGYIRKELGNSYEFISVFHYQPACVNLGKIDPFQWLAILEKSDMIFTSYFHAACFAIKFHKPFLAFGTELKKSKLVDLLGGFGLMNHYIEMEEVKKVNILQTLRVRVDWDGIDQIIKQYQAQFKQLLTRMITE